MRRTVTFETPTARLRGADLGVDGALTVVLHGFTGSSAAMAPLTARLGGRVVSLDLVGHGASEAPDDVAPYRAAAQVDQLTYVLEQLGVRKARLVGYSMGARLALTFAAAHPDRVSALALIGARAGIADATTRAHRIAADEALADEIERDGVAAFVDRWERLPIFASQATLSAHARAAQRQVRLRQRARGLAHSLRGFGAGAMPPLFDRLADVTAPTRLITGALDTPFVALADRLAERLPHATHHQVAGVGHAAHLEAPDETARLVAG